ncbi:MAG: hypothetical protein LBR34_07895 [Prevotella sp.]|jgi:hypothetical protein|nr:hypothetical protein [Prevotella sp.]
MRTNHFFAQALSFILQPLLMPFYSVGMLFFYTNLAEIYPDYWLRFMTPFLILGFLTPVLFIFVLIKLKIVKDFALTERRDRILPYLIACISYLILAYYFYYLGHIYFWMLGIFAVPVIILIFAFLTNLFYGISPHMLGIGGLLGGVMSVCFNVKVSNPFILFVLLFVLAGLLAVARLQLKRDTPAQVYSGFIAGFTLAYLCVWLSAGYTWM